MRRYLSADLTRLILLLVLMLGIFLRLYRLAELPPGDGYDPAYYGVDALEILAGARPVYLTTNFGREALFSYLVALVYLVVGAGTFGIHLTAVVVGILTLPATYFVAQRFFRDETLLLRHWGGVLTTAVMAISYWHLNWSRVGVRAVLVPLFAALVLGFLWQGLETGQRRAFVFCGLWLGLGFYTYQVARLLPVIVVSGFLYYFWQRQAVTKADWTAVLLVAGTAVCVTLPLINYSLNNPGALNERVWQVAVFDDGVGITERVEAIWQQTQKALLMFSIVGDDDPLYNIVDRPALNWLLAIPFYSGLLISLWRWRQPKWLLLLTWFGCMFAPAMIADSAAEAKRAIGTLPAVMIFITVGLVVPWQWLQERAEWSQPARQSLAGGWGLLVASVLLFSLFVTVRDYFGVWGADNSLAFHFQTEKAQLGSYLAEIEAGPVYLSGAAPDHPIIQLHANLRPNVAGFDDRRCVIFPSQTADPVTYLFVTDESHPSALTTLQQTFPNGRLQNAQTINENSQTNYLTFEVSAGSSPLIQPQHVTRINWQNEIVLLGYDLQQNEQERTFPRDNFLTLTLYYQALVDIQQDYTAFAHILAIPNSASATLIQGQVDSQPCGGAVPTSRWQQGDIIQDTIVLPVTSDEPPGLVDLSVGFYHWPSLERLAILDSFERPAAKQALLRTIPVRGGAS